MSHAQSAATVVGKRCIGVSGIDDGLRWRYIGSLLKRHTSVERLQFAWWWKHRDMKASLVDYLATQPDRGRSVAYTYESVARMIGKYPMGKPFNLLEFIEAENFAMTYVPRLDPIHGFAFLKDPLSYYTNRAKRGEIVSDFVLNEEHKHEKNLKRVFSEPLVLRFNLHRPAGAVASQIKELVKGLQKEAGISICRKNRETHSYSNLESWDLRRWKEDKVDELSIHEELKMKISAGLTPAGTSRVSKARKYARKAIESRTEFNWESSGVFIPYDGRGMVNNPFW
jgi:hypothetical protein